MSELYKEYLRSGKTDWLAEELLEQFYNCDLNTFSFSVLLTGDSEFRELVLDTLLDELENGDATKHISRLMQFSVMGAGAIFTFFLDQLISSKIISFIGGILFCVLPLALIIYIKLNKRRQRIHRYIDLAYPDDEFAESESNLEVAE